MHQNDGNNFEFLLQLCTFAHLDVNASFVQVSSGKIKNVAILELENHSTRLGGAS